jgi:ADP-ribose pyrophosphatase
MSDWKILSRKKLLSSKFFEITQEKIQLPNGKQINYDTVDRDPVAMIAPLTDDYQLYMIKQYRHIFKKSILELPAGHLDKNETALSAAKRELKEETGLIAKHWEEMAVVYNSASVVYSKVHLFLAKDLEESECKLEDGEESIGMIKIPLQEAVDKVTSGEINSLATMYIVLLLDKFIREKKL